MNDEHGFSADELRELIHQCEYQIRDLEQQLVRGEPMNIAARHSKEMNLRSQLVVLRRNLAALEAPHRDNAPSSTSGATA